MPDNGVCVYLQQGRLHGWVVEATKGSRRGRGRETWYPREGQQAGEPTASWRLEPTAQPVAQTTITTELLVV